MRKLQKNILIIAISWALACMSGCSRSTIEDSPESTEYATDMSESYEAPTALKIPSSDKLKESYYTAEEILQMPNPLKIAKERGRIYFTVTSYFPDEKDKSFERVYLEISGKSDFTLCYISDIGTAVCQTNRYIYTENDGEDEISTDELQDIDEVTDSMINSWLPDIEKVVTRGEFTDSEENKCYWLESPVDGTPNFEKIWNPSGDKFTYIVKNDLYGKCKAFYVCDQKHILSEIHYTYSDSDNYFEQLISRAEAEYALENKK